MNCRAAQRLRFSQSTLQPRAFSACRSVSLDTMTAQDPLPAGLNAAETNGAHPALRYADIGINLTDPVFRGVHRGKRAHADDLAHVVQRARAAGVRKLMVTGSDLRESQRALELAAEFPGLCYATVGVHPCHATAFAQHPGGAAALIAELRALALSARDAGTAVAFGEIGLDYDRLHFADRDAQLAAFAAQLDLAVELRMPLFLHSRAAAEDFERLLRERLERLPKRGVVHSFTGTLEEMQRIVDMGFDVGINGCSMKTDENMDVVRQVPLERLQIETDGPWCDMRPSHASAKYLADAPPLPKAVKKERWSAEAMVKGRNEPCTISSVAYAIAQVKGISVEEVCEQ